MEKKKGLYISIYLVDIMKTTPRETTFETFVTKNNYSLQIVIPINAAKRLNIEKDTKLFWNEKEKPSSIFYPNNHNTRAIVIPMAICEQERLQIGSCVHVNIKHRNITIRNLNWFEEVQKELKKEDE